MPRARCGRSRWSGLPLYAIAALGYLRLYRERGTKLVFGITVAFVLLAEAMLVVAVAENWRLSWWEWHVLMVLAFASISYAAWKEWPEERFAHLYLDETLSASEEVTLMFADLQGYTQLHGARGARRGDEDAEHLLGRAPPGARALSRGRPGSDRGRGDGDLPRR